MIPSLVYIVRPGDDNEELRYSLRSVAVNLPHCEVWIVGHCPRWVRNVRRVELKPDPEKWRNIAQNARAASERIAADRVVLMADDLFVVESVETMPVFHMGTLSSYIEHVRSRGKDPRSPWLHGLVESLRQSREWGLGDPLCYENHTPLLFDRERLRQALTGTTAHPFLWSAAYPFAGLGGVGTRGTDAKVAGLDRDALRRVLASKMPYLSTTDESFADGEVGRHLRALFPHACIYER